jgi:hypothetical protein
MITSRLIQQLASGLFIIALVSACDQHKTSTVTSVRSQPAGTGSSETTVAGVDFVPSTARIMNLCQKAADAVDYAVPCPLQVPAGLAATKVEAKISCPIEIIRAACSGDPESRGWVFGSSETPDGQHLVIQASPTPVSDYSRFMSGPPLDERSKVRIGSHLTIEGLDMSWVEVSINSDTGAFRGHLVLVWRKGGHTYGVGFHNLAGDAETRALDLALVGGIRMVVPRTGR